MDSTEWKGPGVVMGQDSVMIFVRHGGTCVCVHHFRLQKIDGSHVMLKEKDNLLVGAGNATFPESRPQNDAFTESDEETPSNDKDAEDNNDLPHNSAHSDTTCEALKLKIGQVVTYTDSGSGQAHTAKILSRVGKATGFRTSRQSSAQSI